ASGFHLAPSAGIQHQLPFVSPLSPRAAGASTNHGTTLGGIERSKYNKAGIIDPTVRILEAIPKCAFQRLTDCVMGEIDRARRRQQFPRAARVVQSKPTCDQQ